MREFFILTAMFFTASCVSNPGICKTAPKQNGWVHIDEPPIDLVNTSKPSWGYYFEWFKEDSGLILRCHRSKKAPGCGESAAIYFKRDGAWHTGGVEEVIVCAR